MADDYRNSAAYRHVFQTARDITAKAEAEGRSLTSAERQTVEECVTRLGEMKKSAEMLAAQAGTHSATVQIPNGTPSVPDGSGVGTKSLTGAAQAAGLKASPGQVVRYETFVGAKDLLIGAGMDSSGAGLADDLPVQQLGGIAPLNAVERYVYPTLPTANIDPGTARVEYLQQTGRTLAAEEDALMDFASTSTKPVTDSQVELQSADAHMIATLSGYIPNALLSRADLKAIVDADMRLALNRALEKYVVDGIMGAPTYTDPGEDLVASILKAKQALTDLGYNPSVVVMSSNDSTSLQMLKNAEGTYQTNVPALGTLRVSDSVSDGSPLVLDPNAFGTLMIGTVHVDADSFTRFDTNETRLRMEFPTLLVIRRPEAAAFPSITS